MPIKPPNLDDRRYDDIVREARAKIPQYTPEWTNLGDADPGMTMVQLFAWMTEMIIFRLNRVPDKTYIHFLNFIGEERRQARIAGPEEPGTPMVLTGTIFQPDRTTPAEGVLIYVSAVQIVACNIFPSRVSKIPCCLVRLPAIDTGRLVRRGQMQTLQSTTIAHALSCKTGSSCRSVITSSNHPACKDFFLVLKRRKQRSISHERHAKGGGGRNRMFASGRR